MKDFHQVSVCSGTIIRLLGIAALILVIANIAGQFSRYVLGHGHLLGFVNLFDLDEERNVPTYFSLFLMLTSSILLTVIAIINRKQGRPQVSKWVVLSLGFLIMSYDEAFCLHEQWGQPIRMLLGDNTPKFFFYDWAIPAIALVIALGCYFYKFLLSLPAKTRLRFLISAIIYIGGCIGVEFPGGFYAQLHGAQKSLTYAMIATVEESLEMLGLIIFIWALLKYIAKEFREVRLAFDFVAD